MSLPYDRPPGQLLISAASTGLPTMNTAGAVFHPGEYLRDELVERGWTVPEFARIIGWSVSDVSRILDGERRITAATARDLADMLGTTSQVWLNLQAAWDRHSSRHDRRLER